MDKDRADPILDVETYELFLRALSTGDPGYYHEEKASTHPYFGKGIEKISFLELEELSRFLQEEIGRQTQDLDSMRARVPYEKNLWIVEEAVLQQNVERLQIQVNRLWHLRMELEKHYLNRLNTLSRHCASNLNLRDGDLDPLARTYGANILTALAAGWTKQPIGEA